MPFGSSGVTGASSQRAQALASMKATAHEFGALIRRNGFPLIGVLRSLGDP